MLKLVVRGLLGRLIGLGLFGGGFWLLVMGFVDARIPLGVLGGAMILLGMWVIAQIKRG